MKKDFLVVISLYMSFKTKITWYLKNKSFPRTVGMQLNLGIESIDICSIIDFKRIYVRFGLMSLKATDCIAYIFFLNSQITSDFLFTKPPILLPSSDWIKSWVWFASLVAWCHFPWWYLRERTRETLFDKWYCGVRLST